MALSDKAELEPPPTLKGPRCSVCIALDALPREDGAVLIRWMSDAAWTDKEIADQTRADPDTPTLAYHAICNHRTGQCAAGVRLRP